MRFTPLETVKVRCGGEEFEGRFAGPSWEVGPDDRVWVYLGRWRTPFPAKMVTPQAQQVLVFFDEQ